MNNGVGDATEDVDDDMVTMQQSEIDDLKAESGERFNLVLLQCFCSAFAVLLQCFCSAFAVLLLCFCSAFALLSFTL
jgi:hypothetical protein